MVVAMRDGSATKPTLPAGWTEETTAGRATAPAILVALRVKNASWTTMPTFTNASECHALRITGGNVADPMGAANVGGGTAISIAFPALDTNVDDGSSVVIRAAAHTRPDAVMTAPANHTLIQAAGVQPGFISCRPNSSVNPATASVTTSRSAAYSYTQFEMLADTGARSGTDSAALSEADDLAVGISLSDLGTLSEAPQLDGAVFGVDSAALSEEAVLDVLPEGGGDTPVEASDSAVLSETLGLLVSLSVTDSATLSEAPSLATSLVAADSAGLSEAQTLQAQMARSDSASVSEATAATAQIASSDTGILAESTALSQQLFMVVSDSGSLSESANLQIGNFLAVADSIALIESPSVSAALAAADSATLNEAAVITAQIAVVQGMSLSESASLVAGLTGLDSAALSEAAQGVVLAVTMIEASDLVATLQESSGVEVRELPPSPVVITVGPRLSSFLVPRGPGPFTDVRPSQSISRYRQ